MLDLHRCPRAFSNCDQRGILFIAMLALLIAVASRVAGRGLSARGLQESARGLRCCSSWALERRLIRCGLVLPWHVGLSQTGDQTRVSSLGRWILNHSTTREDPHPRPCLVWWGLVTHLEMLGSLSSWAPDPATTRVPAGLSWVLSGDPQTHSPNPSILRKWEALLVKPQRAHQSLTSSLCEQSTAHSVSTWHCL